MIDEQMFLPKRVTVKDVAALAGVGHPSVSVVLNGARSGMHVAPATRQRILQAAEDLGYRPNTSARAMKTGRFGCVGLLTSTEPKRSNIQLEMQRGIHDELAAHDLHLMLVQAPDASLTDEAAVPRLLREWMVDGLLIGYNVGVPSQMAEIINQHHIPSVWLNADQEFDCVRPDDENGTYAATKHLLQLGHRRIAYISIARPVHYSVAARERGYLPGDEEAGLAPQVHEEDLEFPDARNTKLCAVGLLSMRPTAMLFYGGESAVLTFYAAQQMGLRVPEDLSLVSTGETRLPASTPQSTRLLIPFYEIGRESVRQLLRKIENPSEVLPAQTLPLALVPGETCAPAPRDA
jgi:LacI family transcriptional regulator